MATETRSLADIIGPWQEPDFNSGLIDRLRRAWTKPVSTLTNHELATCLRQAIAVEHILPIAKMRIDERVDDDSEIDDAELATAIEDFEYRAMREREHQRIMARRFTSDYDRPKT